MPSLNYYLTPFAPSAKDKDSRPKYIARPARSGVMNDQQLARLIAERCTLTEADIHATLIELRLHILRTVAEGGRVNLQGLVEFYPKLRGTFDDLDERRDPKRHKINIGARPCKSLNKELSRQQISWRRVPGPDETAIIYQVRDTRSGELNATLSPGGPVGLSGVRLKFSESRPDEGVFLIPVRQPNGSQKATPSAQTATKAANSTRQAALPREIRMNHYFGVRPKEVWFLAPDDLPAGQYELELRTRSRGGEHLLRERCQHRLTCPELVERASDYLSEDTCPEVVGVSDTTATVIPTPTPERIPA
ncbi:DUF4469 domain-containing protein [Cerasicoccus frondis]|uniref:HU family DNA-binding protein n=1 Tax=Cerasicoccus frondis TaxID=490090 RepID=UPI0028526DBE|nr:DUF4469 domain-containing protein [Cerasicoccus frondis]